MFTSFARAWNRFFSMIDKIFATGENVCAVAEVKSRVFRIEGEAEAAETLKALEAKGINIVLN